MKKHLFVLALILCTSIGYAQNIGVRAGYIISNWQGIAYVSDMQVETINGYSIGVYGHAPLNPIIVFEPGIFITPKGARMMAGPFPEPITNKSLYLDVPIMVKMYLGGGGFHVNAGPQVSYLLSNKEVLDSGQENINTDTLRRWDFAISFGLAYDLKFGMNIGASYDLGLSNMLINEYFDWTEVGNRVLRFSIGYTFY